MRNHQNERTCLMRSPDDFLHTSLGSYPRRTHRSKSLPYTNFSITLSPIPKVSALLSEHTQNTSTKKYVERSHIFKDSRSWKWVTIFISGQLLDRVRSFVCGCLLSGFSVSPHRCRPHRVSPQLVCTCRFVHKTRVGFPWGFRII